MASKPQGRFDLGLGFPTLGGLGGNPQYREEMDSADGEASRLSVNNPASGF